MKKLLFFAAILLSLQAIAQVSPNGSGEIFNLIPSTAQRVRSSDSVQVWATLATNRIVSSIAWAQTGGTTLKISPVTNWFTGAVATSSFWLQGLAPGTYIFKATGLSSTGTTGTVADTITVVADPICPPPPAPRTVTSVQINIGGIWYAIPAAALKFGFSDGGNQ